MGERLPVFLTWNPGKDYLFLCDSVLKNFFLDEMFFLNEMVMIIDVSNGGGRVIFQCLYLDKARNYIGPLL